MPVKTFRCYLCGHNECITRDGHARDDASLVPLECRRCGLVCLSSFSHISDGFYEDSRMHDQPPCDTELMLSQSREDDVRRYSQLEAVISGKRVLDIGCGAGGFLLEAKKVAAFVAGVEPERRLGPHFKENGLEVVADLASLAESLKPDVITMFHVLEHIPDPLAMLRQIRDKFYTQQNSPLLCIEVPNATDALLCLYESPEFARFTYWSCHLFLFNEQNLQDLAQKAGFRTMEMRQIQRYPLANHLYWLAKGKPGGHVAWDRLSSKELASAYENTLKGLKMCDTIMGIFT